MGAAALMCTESLAFADVAEEPSVVIIEQDPPEPAPKRVTPPIPETERHWYGWQILITDGASVVTMPILIGFGGYALGGPIVHMAHGEYLRALGSLGIRLGAPFIGGFTALAFCTPKGDFGCLGEGLIGFAVGGLTAMAVDSAALAWETRPVQKETRSARVVPVIKPRMEGGAEIGAALSF